MAVKIGGTNLSDIRVGTAQIVKAYVGSTLVYESQPPVTLGTFSYRASSGLQPMQYRFEVGMTWAQFVASSYNSGGFALSGSTSSAVVDSSGRTVRNSEGLSVLARHTVIDGEEYVGYAKGLGI